MEKTTEVFVIITIATFAGFFLVEAPLWNVPFVHDLLIPQLNPGLPFPSAEQAEILRALFINQGVYNLMVAAGGIAGLIYLRRGQAEIGRRLVIFTCLFAVGAAITLLLTTHAYVLGVLQALFPLVAIVQMMREAKRISR